VSAAAQSRRGVRLTHIAAVAAGNGLEFYDFLIFSTFALYIGRTYFPAHGPGTSLLLSLATFGIGFATRPIGGIVLGRLGDKVGRRPAMLISFGLMAVGLSGVAVTPGYAQIGIAAPILVVAARLVQGFALGGEVGPSSSFLIEAAAPERRGLMGSLQNTSQALASLCGALVALGLSLSLPEAALASWGWRAAFLIGLLIVPFGLVVRRSLPETAPHKIAAEAPTAPAPFPLRLVLVSSGLLISGTVGTYVLQYMTTYALAAMHMAPSAAFGIGVVSGVSGLVWTPLGGWLSDRFGRRPVIIPGMIVSTLMFAPVYALMLSGPSLLALYVSLALLAVPGGLATGAMLVAIAESFRPGMRSFAVGTIYAVIIAAFGGTTQVIVEALVQATHQPLAPAVYRVAALVIGVVAAFNLPESAPVKLGPAATSD
jgi:MFS family permease